MTGLSRFINLVVGNQGYWACVMDSSPRCGIGKEIVKGNPSVYRNGESETVEASLVFLQCKGYFDTRIEYRGERYTLQT